MPVDYLIAIIPLVFAIASLVAIFSKTKRNFAIAIGFVDLFLFGWLYLWPGWVLKQRALKGDAFAQLELGRYYWTRFGNLGSNIELRDTWFLKAAQSGQPRAMELVGYYYIFGSSSVIPKDYPKAHFWLNAALKAGDGDAPGALKTLAEEESKK